MGVSIVGNVPFVGALIVGNAPSCTHPSSETPLRESTHHRKCSSWAHPSQEMPLVDASIVGNVPSRLPVSEVKLEFL